MTFDPPNMVGPYQKRVHLEAANGQQYTITVKARINQPLLATFRPDKDGDRLGIVTVRNDGDEDIRLLYSTTSEPWLYIEMPKEPVSAGGELELNLRTTEPDKGLPAGLSATIHTADQKFRSVNVQFR